MVDAYKRIFAQELEGLWRTSNRLPKNTMQWVSTKNKLLELAFYKFHGCPRFEKAHLIIGVGYLRAKRFDLLNISPMLKPLIDGAIKAGILPDDDAKHLLTVHIYPIAKPISKHQITLEFIKEHEE